MRNKSLVFGVGLALGLLVTAGPAAADIAPPGLCAPEDVGQVCDNALDKDGNELSEPGVCVAEKCKRATPDGTMKYDCVMCRLEPSEPTAGGAGGGANDPAPPSAGSAGKPSEPTEGGSAGDGSVKPTAGSGGKDSPIKGGSASTAGKAGKDTDDTNDDGGCSIGMGGRASGVVTVSSLLALALVLGRRRGQRRA